MPTLIQPGQRYALPSGRYVAVVKVHHDLVDCAYIADRHDPFAPKTDEPGVHFLAETLRRIARPIGAPHA